MSMMDLIAATFAARREYVALIAGLLISAIVYSAQRAWARRRGASVRAHTPPADLPEKRLATKERAPGEWEPTQFDYPRVEACNEHFSTLKPIPYRPFKWGDYHVTMGIRGMNWNEWIELDRDFPQVHKVVEYRIRTAGERLVQVRDAQPGAVGSGHLAAREFMYELAEYLSRRHPDVYSVTRHPVSKNEDENGWYGEGRIKTITIIPFEETHDLDTEEPLKAARMLIQEDFTIMMEGSDGRYYLQAGAVVIPGSWRLEDKMGMPMEDIHTSGNVPQYKTKLQMSMDRFIRRMPLDKPVVRNNYAFQVVQEAHTRSPRPAPGSLLAVDPDELSWAATMNGSEQMSDYVRAKHINDQWDTAEDIAPGMRPGLQKTTEATPATLRLRTERQTLRRLPKTGAVVFTIRVYQTRVEELLGEPGVPGRMASAIRSWPEDVARYKARGAYESILPLLDEAHAEQIEKGIVSDEDKKSNANFPF